MWSGISVSPGIASGSARIVRHPNDAAHLLQGDILVAPSTDPGWTPLFLRAAAIVMETGGFLSHGAIVAREYGIPAVANVPGILKALHDGEPIAVDGSRGRVTRTVG
jgi:pyruvate,water dikinase